MSYEIRHLHIEPNTPEGQTLDAIIARDHVTPEEAVRILLREASPRLNAAEQMIGMFSSDADASLMDDIMTVCRDARETPSTRDVGL